MSEIANELRRIAAAGVWISHHGTNLLVNAAEEIEQLRADNLEAESMKAILRHLLSQKAAGGDDATSR